VLFLVRMLVESASCRRAPLSRQLRPPRGSRLL